MRNFKHTFETRKRSFISAFLILMNVPLNTQYVTNYDQTIPTNLYLKIVTKAAYSRKRIKLFRFHINSQKTFRHELWTYFVTFSSSFDPNPNSLHANVNRNVNPENSTFAESSRIKF